MQDIIFSHSSRPLTEEELTEVEQYLKFSLPPDVRRFYLRQNGGRPMPHLFPMGGELYGVSRFLPIKYPNPPNYLTVDSTYRDLTTKPATSRFPKYLVPIAIDGGGDHYCFSARVEDFGAILCFAWDYYDDPERSTIWLSKSLDAFLDSLIEET